MMKKLGHQAFVTLQVNEMTFSDQNKVYFLLSAGHLFTLKFYRYPTRRSCPWASRCWFICRTSCTSEFQFYWWWSRGAPASTWCPKCILALISKLAQLGWGNMIHILLFVSVLTELVNSPDIAFIRSTVVKGKKREKSIAILLWEFDLQFWLRTCTFLSQATRWY